MVDLTRRRLRRAWRWSWWEAPISALEAREIIYGAIGLAFSFFGVAGLFFLLDAPFVAVFQITVYIGAVAVLILFTVMLVREGRWMRDSLGSAREAGR